MSKRILQRRKFFINSYGGRIGNFWWSNAGPMPIGKNKDGTFQKVWKEGNSYLGEAPNVFFFNPVWAYWKLVDRINCFFHRFRRNHD